MSKLSQIAEGWYNLATQPEHIQATAKERLDVCDVCPSKIQIGPMGQTILQVLNRESSVFKCGECGCPLSTITVSPDYHCKKGKW